MQTPETRPSLLVRIRDRDDRDAWQEFAEIYRPVVVRMGCQKGMQNADAEDLAQRVLISVSGAIANFDPHGEALFRTWLKKITHNAILKAITRAKPDQPRGGASSLDGQGELSAGSQADRERLNIEYRRELFRWAAAQVRDEFSPATWQSFWMTAVQELPIKQAAEQLGRSLGSVYASRSRVVKRLMSKIEELESDEERQTGQDDERAQS